MQRRRGKGLNDDGLLSIHFTGPSFDLDGISFPSLPLCIRPGTMRIEFLPSAYLKHIALVRAETGSPKTWRFYAYQLLDFLNFMERYGFDWSSPEEKHLGFYKKELFERKVKRPEAFGTFRRSAMKTRKTDRTLSRNTISRKLRIVCDFYKWANDRKYIDHLPFTYDHVITLRTTTRRRYGFPRPRPSVVPRSRSAQKRPPFFTRDDREVLYRSLSDRDRLIMEWALYTGIREFELCALTVGQVPAQDAYRRHNFFVIELRVTKGDGLKELYVPTWLIKKTNQYINLLGRPEIVRWAKEHGREVPPNIFLSRRATGLKPNSVYQNFEAAIARANLFGSFHWLRHTYAICTLDRLMNTTRYAGTDGRNALVDLRDLMRHKSVESTEHYLEARKFYLTELYSDLYDLPSEFAHV